MTHLYLEPSHTRFDRSPLEHHPGRNIDRYSIRLADIHSVVRDRHNSRLVDIDPGRRGPEHGPADRHNRHCDFVSQRGDIWVCGENVRLIVVSVTGLVLVSGLATLRLMLIVVVLAILVVLVVRVLVLASLLVGIAVLVLSSLRMSGHLGGIN